MSLFCSIVLEPLDFRTLIRAGTSRLFPPLLPLQRKTHADVSNVPLRLTRETEACVLGSAVLAAVGAGIFPDIPSAIQAMVHVERTVVSGGRRSDVRWAYGRLAELVSPPTHYARSRPPPCLPCGRSRHAICLNPAFCHRTGYVPFFCVCSSDCASELSYARRHHLGENLRGS